MADVVQEDPAASAAVAATMEQLDFQKLLQQVDSGYRSWRKPSLLLFGANDPFVDVNNPFAFLDDKRTNMRLVTATAKVGAVCCYYLDMRFIVLSSQVSPQLEVSHLALVGVRDYGHVQRIADHCCGRCKIWLLVATQLAYCGCVAAAAAAVRRRALVTDCSTLRGDRDAAAWCSGYHLCSLLCCRQPLPCPRGRLHVAPPPCLLFLQLGHVPQEDYPEAIQDTLEAFLRGETDSWPMGKVVASKMTKRGVVDA